MDIYLQNCVQCHKRTPVVAMIPILGKRYCEGCGAALAKLVNTQRREPRLGIIRCQTVKEVKRPSDMVKWWDAKRGKWRLVAKRSKPELKPYREGDGRRRKETEWRMNGHTLATTYVRSCLESPRNCNEWNDMEMEWLGEGRIGMKEGSGAE